MLCIGVPYKFQRRKRFKVLKLQSVCWARIFSIEDVKLCIFSLLFSSCFFNLSCSVLIFFSFSTTVLDLVSRRLIVKSLLVMSFSIFSFIDFISSFKALCCFLCFSNLNLSFESPFKELKSFLSEVSLHSQDHNFRVALLSLDPLI